LLILFYLFKPKGTKFDTSTRATVGCDETLNVPFDLDGYTEFYLEANVEFDPLVLLDYCGALRVDMAPADPAYAFEMDAIANCGNRFSIFMQAVCASYGFFFRFLQF
jgi:hypothetical protein